MDSKRIKLNSLSDPRLALLRERAADPNYVPAPNDFDGRPTAQKFTDPLNRGLVAASVGAPVDLINIALNLARAGYGTLGHATGLLSASQMPDLEEKPFGGSEHIGDLMHKYGMVSEHRDPMLEMAAGLLPLAPKGLSMAVNSTRPGRNLVRIVKNTDPLKAAVEELARKPSANERAVKVSKRGWVGPIAEGDATSVSGIRNPGIFEPAELVHTHSMNTDMTLNPLSAGDRSPIPVSALHTEPNNGRLTVYRERLGSGQPPTFDDYVRQEDYVNQLLKDPTYSSNVDSAQYKTGWLDPNDVAPYSGENLGAKVASEVHPNERAWLDSLRGGMTEEELQAIWPKKGVIMTHNEAPRGNAWRVAELSDLVEGGPDLYRFENGWNKVNVSDIEPEYFDFLKPKEKPASPAKYYHAGADFTGDFNPGSFFTPDKSAAETFKNNFGHPKLHEVELNPVKTATDRHVNDIAKELGVYEPDTPTSMYLEQGENSVFGPEIGSAIVDRLRKMGFDSAVIEDGMSSNPTTVALDPKIITRSDGLQVVKPKGGNWLDKRATRSFTGEDQIASDPQHVINELTDPYRFGDGYGVSEEEKALADWGNKQLKRYIQNEMATPEDPIRVLAERGITHKPNPAGYAGLWGNEDAIDAAEMYRSDHGLPEKNLGQSPLAKAWENESDNSILPLLAGDQTNHVNNNPWLSKLNPGDRVYSFSPEYGPAELVEADRFGFKHLMDELKNSIDPNSGLPPELLMKYSSLDRLSVPQAVERVHKINEWRANNLSEAEQALANNPATVLHKEYPDTGFKWVQLRQPEALTDDQIASFAKDIRVKKSLGDDPAVRGRLLALQDALKYEGDTMGHCVGGYCDQVANGRTNIFSLRDEKGRPHVTIETRPGSEQAKLALADKSWQHNVSPEQLAQLETQAAPTIIQIKGKGNAKPADKYLPMVQDFIRSQKWGKVGDFHNTGMFQGDAIANDTFHPIRTRLVNTLNENYPGMKLSNSDLNEMLKGKYYVDHEELIQDLLNQVGQRQQ